MIAQLWCIYNHVTYIKAADLIGVKMASKMIEHSAVSRETLAEAVKAINPESESEELSRMRRKEEHTTGETEPEEKEGANGLGLKLQKKLLDNDRVISLLSIPIFGAVVAMGLLVIIGTGYLIDAVKPKGKEEASGPKS
jgi:hypothetical protein